MRNFFIKEQKMTRKTISTIVAFLLLMCTTAVFGQGALTGKIVDTSGEPLIGVNVLVQGTTTGSITDIDGNYNIPQAPARGTLVISYVGYLSEEIAFSSQRANNVTLREDAIGLEEMIVVGYGTRKAGEMTGAVATVKAEAIQRLASVDQTEVLRNVPGVTVLQSNNPGAEATVRVRGLGTINNSAPLWVVDGVPNAQVSPDDIETITVLKDAAAQAIYGTRAANGVVLVTTKQGRRNERATVSVNVRYGTQRMVNNYDFLNTQEYGEMLWLQAKNAGITNYSHPLYGDGATPVIPDYINPIRGKEGEVDYSTYSFTTVEEGGPGLNQIVKANKEGTEWLKSIARTSTYQDYSVGVSGGSERTTYSFNFSYLNTEGIFYHTGFDRLNVRSNIRTDVNKWITISQNLSVMYTNQKGMDSDNSESSPVGLAYRNQPIIPVYDVMGNFAGAGSVPGGGTGNGRSPMELLWNNKDDNVQNMRIMGSVRAELNLMEGLKFSSQASMNYNPYTRRNIDLVVKTYTERSRYDTLEMTHRVTNQWTWTNNVEYKKQIGRHDFTLMAGTEAVQSSRLATSAARTEFLSKDENYMYLDAGIQNQTNSGQFYEWALFSVFGRFNYTYDSKYMLELVVRRDGSSRFAEGHRYGVFPAFSAGWTVSREKFMAPTRTWLDNLKIRGGWGKTGNDQVGSASSATGGNYNSYTTFDFASGGAGSFYAINGGQNTQGTLGFRPAVYGVTDVKWESTNATNFGIDVSLKMGLNITFDVWHRKTVDMLYNKQIPRVDGVYTSTPSVNIGEMKNQGFDLTVGYRGNALNRELQYNLNLNISQYKNEIISLGTNPTEFIEGGGYRGINYTRAMAGTAYPEFYGYIVDGIFQTREEADAHARAFGRTGTYNKPGVYKFRDVNGDGIIDPNDRTWIGSPHPDFSGGLDFNIDYKGFDLNGQFYGLYGNKMANDAQRWLNFTQYEGARGHDRLYNSWGSPYLSDNSKAKLIIAEADDSASQVSSTALLEDGSYLRLRNLQLGYNLKKLMPNVAEISALRLYVQVTNVFTFTKYSGLNPESTTGGQNNGVDSGAWPLSRQVMFGLSIGL